MTARDAVLFLTQPATRAILDVLPLWDGRTHTVDELLPLANNYAALIAAYATDLLVARHGPAVETLYDPQSGSPASFTTVSADDTGKCVRKPFRSIPLNRGIKIVDRKLYWKTGDHGQDEWASIMESAWTAFRQSVWRNCPLELTSPLPLWDHWTWAAVDYRQNGIRIDALSGRPNLENLPYDRTRAALRQQDVPSWLGSGEVQLLLRKVEGWNGHKNLVDDELLPWALAYHRLIQRDFLLDDLPLINRELWSPFRERGIKQSHLNDLTKHDLERLESHWWWLAIDYGSWGIVLPSVGSSRQLPPETGRFKFDHSRQVHEVYPLDSGYGGYTSHRFSPKRVAKPR